MAASLGHLAVCMEVMFDYEGIRVTALPLLDLEREVVYGSGDGGRSFHNHSAVHHALQYVARKLHLAVHPVGRSGPLLACAGDLEAKYAKSQQLISNQEDPVRTRRCHSAKLFCWTLHAPSLPRPRGCAHICPSWATPPFFAWYSSFSSSF